MAFELIVTIAYGGRFVQDSTEVKYVGGTKIVRKFDPDRFSRPELDDIMRENHVEHVSGYVYTVPDSSSDEGLKKIETDKDIIQILNVSSNHNGNISIYVEHQRSIPKPVNMDSYFGDDELQINHDENHEEDDDDDSSWNGFTDDEKSESDGEFDMLYKSSLNGSSLMDAFSNDQQIDIHDADSDYLPSDKILSPPCSEDDSDNGTSRKRKRGKMFIPAEDGKVAGFELLQTFDSKEQLLNVVRTYGIIGGYSIKFEKNDKWRVVAKCLKPCGWHLRGSLMQNEKTWQIKTYNSAHDCHREPTNKCITSTWLVKRYMRKFVLNPTLKASIFQDEVIDDLRFSVPISKCYRAKSKALKIIRGTSSYQYGRLWDYAQELHSSNPGSTIKLHLDGGRFKRIYICFAALRKGFLEGCRPIIGLDGCFLKTHFGGQLLSAVSKDGNEGMFPIAYAVVESENKETWKWFLELFMSDLKSEKGHGFTIISDEQKGLISVLEELCPAAEKRSCVRHLYGNLSKLHRGQGLRLAIWLAARATYKNEWLSRMEEVKKINEGAYIWLGTLSPSLWTRSAFSSNSKCDALLNNFTESWNSSLLKARELPIIQMLEKIRKDTNVRIEKRKFRTEKWLGILGERVQKKLDKSIMDSRVFTIVPNAHSKLETSPGSFVVDLDQRTCSCRQWDISGIPCAHATSAIYYKKRKPEEFVADYFTKQYYLKAYAQNILPVQGESFWAPTGLNAPLPPDVPEKKRGKQKKARKKGDAHMEAKVNPTKASRVNGTVTCSLCHQKGHNKRKCRNKEVSQEPSRSAEPTSELSRSDQIRLRGQISRRASSSVISKTGPSHLRSTIENGVRETGRTEANKNMPKI